MYSVNIWLQKMLFENRAIECTTLHKITLNKPSISAIFQHIVIKRFNRGSIVVVPVLAGGQDDRQLYVVMVTVCRADKGDL